MPAAACQWCLEKEKKLFWCSKCKASSYCSADCQRNHWKNGHKQDCKKYCEKIANATAGDDEFAAFVQVYKDWRDEFTSTLPMLLVQKLGAKYCFTVQPPSKIIKILLTFNASTRLFKVEDISTLVLASLENTDDHVQIRSSINQAFETHNQRHPSKPIGFAWVHCNGVAAIMPAILDKKMKRDMVKLASEASVELTIKMMEDLRV